MANHSGSPGVTYRFACIGPAERGEDPPLSRLAEKWGVDLGYLEIGEREAAFAELHKDRDDQPEWR